LKNGISIIINSHNVLGGEITQIRVLSSIKPSRAEDFSGCFKADCPWNLRPYKQKPSLANRKPFRKPKNGLLCPTMGVRGFCFFMLITCLSWNAMATSCQVSMGNLATSSSNPLIQFIGRGEEARVFRVQISEHRAIVIKWLKRLRPNWTQRDRNVRIQRKMIMQSAFAAAGLPHKRILYIPYIGAGFQTFARGITLSRLADLRDDQVKQNASVEKLKPFNELIEAGKQLLARAVDAAGPALQEAYSSGLIPSTKNTENLSAYQLPDISFTNVIFQIRAGRISTTDIYLIDW